MLKGNKQQNNKEEKMRVHQKSGFTLLEIIIVIIIIAILASVAMPRLVAVTDYGKAKEALGVIPLARQEMDMCANTKSTFTYANCTLSTTLAGKYFTDPTVSGQNATNYIITVPNVAGAFSAATTITYTESTKSIAGTGSLANFKFN